MDLVEQGETLPVAVALNSYSWAYSGSSVGFLPYGVQSVLPSSGPYDGNTEVLITGKGFDEEIANVKARCRFGNETNFVTVEA